MDQRHRWWSVRRHGSIGVRRTPCLDHRPHLDANDIRHRVWSNCGRSGRMDDGHILSAAVCTFSRRRGGEGNGIRDNPLAARGARHGSRHDPQGCRHRAALRVVGSRGCASRRRWQRRIVRVVSNAQPSRGSCRRRRDTCTHHRDGGSCACWAKHARSRHFCSGASCCDHWRRNSRDISVASSPKSAISNCAGLTKSENEF